MRITAGPFSTDHSEIQLVFRKVLSFSRKKPPRLLMIELPLLAHALTNGVRFLLEDRIESGIGVGGWGKSDRIYMTDLYGEKEGGTVHESIMTTSVCVLALHSYSKLCQLALQDAEQRKADESWKSILHDLNPYLENRWDKKTGCGGTLAMGMDGVGVLAPRYRHTAWLLDLWLDIPRYYHQASSTLDALIREFENQNWTNEKVATPVAAHAAFYSAMNVDALADTAGKSKLRHSLTVCEHVIADKYIRSLRGWTSGLSQEGGRQAYTLFTIAHMSHLWTSPQSPLLPVLEDALIASLDAPWWVKGGGAARHPNGPLDISASCLLASALMRKPILSARETACLDETLRALTDDLGKRTLIGSMPQEYSWAVAFFVRSACDCLRKAHTERLIKG